MPANAHRTRPVVLVTAPLKPEAMSALTEELGGDADVRSIEEASDAEILIGWRPMQEIRDSTGGGADPSRVRFIQLLSAGADHLSWDDIPDDVAVAGNVGAYAEPMAEHVLAMTLAIAKRLPVKHAAMARGEYPRGPASRSLDGAACGVLGFGGIGRACARLLRGVGMRIHAVNSSGRTDEPVAWAGTLGQLDEVLRAADVLVIALPLTRRTRGLIGAEELAAMKPDAILVNVARAAIVEEDALFEHLRTHPDFSAAIDVWWDEPRRDEPFRPRRPFLDLQNVLGSPHNSGIVPGIEVVAARMAARNVLRFLRGEPVAGMMRRLDYLQAEG